MRAPVKILLQTTIVPTEDDWSIARFSLLETLLALDRVTKKNAFLEDVFQS